MPLTRQTMIDAGVFAVTNHYMYSNENRGRVHASILAEASLRCNLVLCALLSYCTHFYYLFEDPELQRRYLAGISGDSPEFDEDDFDAAEEELHARADAILKREYEELPESEKESFRQAGIEWRYNMWRDYRAKNILLENEESLKQKEEDETNGITGPIPRTTQSKKSGQSSEAATSQVVGSVVGEQALTSTQALTPPFDRDTLKMKTGKLEPEEYF